MMDMQAEADRSTDAAGPGPIEQVLLVLVRCLSLPLFLLMVVLGCLIYGTVAACRGMTAVAFRGYQQCIQVRTSGRPASPQDA